MNINPYLSAMASGIAKNNQAEGEDASPAEGKPAGETFTARVLGQKDGVVNLRAQNGQRFTALAETDRPLQPGQTVELTVVGQDENGTPKVAVSRDGGVKLSSYLSAMGAEDTPAAREMARELVGQKVLVTPKQFESLMKHMEKSPELTPQKAAFMLKHNIPITAQTISQYNALTEPQGQLGALLNDLLGALESALGETAQSNGQPQAQQTGQSAAQSAPATPQTATQPQQAAPQTAAQSAVQGEVPSPVQPQGQTQQAGQSNPPTAPSTAQPSAPSTAQPPLPQSAQSAPTTPQTAPQQPVPQAGQPTGNAQPTALPQGQPQTAPQTGPPTGQPTAQSSAPATAQPPLPQTAQSVPTTPQTAPQQPVPQAGQPTGNAQPPIQPQGQPQSAPQTGQPTGQPNPSTAQAASQPPLPQSAQTAPTTPQTAPQQPVPQAGQPTGNAQPPIQPQGQPQPAGQPAVQGNGQPTAQPTMPQPTGQPTAQPSAPSTAQPPLPQTAQSTTPQTAPQQPVPQAGQPFGNAQPTALPQEQPQAAPRQTAQQAGQMPPHAPQSNLQAPEAQPQPPQVQPQGAATQQAEQTTPTQPQQSGLADTLNAIFRRISPERNKILQKDLDAPRLTKEIGRLLSDVLETARSLPENQRGDVVRAARDLVDSLRFTEQLNQCTAFVQLPVQIGGEKTTAQLYVFNDSEKKRKIDPQNATMFLSLATAYLGQVEGFVKVIGKNVECDFSLMDDTSVAAFRSGMNELSELLEARGYRLARAGVIVSKDKAHPASVEKSRAERMNRYQFDKNA